MAKHSKKEVQEAFDTLRKMLKPGDTVHTILDNVSRSGMSRNIRVVVQRIGCQCLTRHIARDARGRLNWRPFVFYS